MSKKRTYLESYVDLGFDFIIKDDVQPPQCIFCSIVLGMKPSILRAHCTSCYFTFVHDDRRCLTAKRTRFCAAGTLPSLGFVSEDKSALDASYRVAWRIAKKKKPHTIGELVIKPCAMDMFELICGKEQKKQIEKIALSNDTVRRRITDLSQNILDQAAEEIRKARISPQVNELTDVLKCAYLLIYCQYVHGGE